MANSIIINRNANENMNKKAPQKVISMMLDWREYNVNAIVIARVNKAAIKTVSPSY
jgi:hypothetical protein